MDYGIGIPSWIDAWKEVVAAEEAGFTHAWFYDSQLIYSDVWATMALAAHHTSTIKLGTLVAIRATGSRRSPQRRPPRSTSWRRGA